MKTLLISEVFPPQTGGSGRWLWEVYRRFPADEIAIAAGEHPEAEAFDRDHTLNLVRLPLRIRNWGIGNWSGAKDYWRAWRSLKLLYQDHHPQAIHCARFLPEGWLAWLFKKRFGLPYMCYVHGEEANYALASRELGWMTRRVQNGAEFLIANSQNTRRLLLEDWNIPAEKIRVVHPGCDTTRFVPADPDSHVRSALGWDDRLVLLTVGRLEKRKGHDKVIEALRVIRQSVPDVLYSIVGGGAERAALEQLSREQGVAEHVQFRGEPGDAELIQCYQQCDLFVLANRQVNQEIEGFGMVLIEAQACGKPVLAGRSGGTAETMKIPESGEVIPCETSDRLAEIIPRWLLDREKLSQMGRAGRRWAVENFDWENLSCQASVVLAEGFSKTEKAA